LEKEILFIKITVSLVLESRVLKLIYDGVERKDDELGVLSQNFQRVEG
jgi:hypothetical protein